MTKRGLSQPIIKLFQEVIGVSALLLSMIFLAGPVHAAGHSKGDLRVYMFGHSLVNDASGPSSVPYWMTVLSRSDSTTFRFAGQWGFLQQHVASLPPQSRWSFDGAPSFWNHELDSFAAANFNTILITPSNFSQWQHPTIVYESGSPVSHTLELIDWVTAQAQQGVNIYIYENWPDMGGFLANGFPPTKSEFATYNAYTLGGFKSWWVEYLTELSSARPDVQITSIPVGPTIAKMLTETSLLAGIPVTELYYDDAPHGEPTIYFLASLVTYAGMYNKMPPEDFAVPSNIHPVVGQNYKDIIRFIAWELGIE